MNKNVIAFNKSCIGSNHIKNHKVCEDSSLSYSDDRLLFVHQDIRMCAVADGHGSDDYPRTDRGSKFAVETLADCVKLFIKDISYDMLVKDKKNDIFNNLVKSILSLWYERVVEDYNNNPFTEEELNKVSGKYKKKFFAIKEHIEKENIEDERDISAIAKAYGTTLIAFVETDKYCFGLQIGDGKCIALDDNCNFFEPIPWDEQCQLNITTSLCDEDALEEFRFYRSDKFPIAVFCESDGIDDSYSSIEQVYGLYRSILKIFNDYDPDRAIKEIEEYLPTLSKKGSGDDVSIAGIVDTEKLKLVKDVLLRQSEEFITNQKKDNENIETGINEIIEQPKNTENTSCEIIINDKYDALKHMMENGKEMIDSADISSEEKKEMLEKTDKAIEKIDKWKKEAENNE